MTCTIQHLLVSALALAALPASAIYGQVLYRQDFERIRGELPRAVRDNSGWAGTSVPMRVVDSGDPRYGRWLECEVSGFGQMILGHIGSIEAGKVYRVALDMASTGRLEAEVMLRLGGSPYTIYAKSVEAVAENMRRVEFLGRSSTSGPKNRRTLVMLIVRGFTTLTIDNVTIEAAPAVDLVPEPPSPANHVLNSSFELFGDGWMCRNGVTFETRDDAPDGEVAARLARGAILTSVWERYNLGSPYLVRVRARALSQTCQLAFGTNPFVFPYGSRGGRTKRVEIDPQDGWKTVSLEWTPRPAGGKIERHPEYYVNVQNRGPGDVLVDAVEVRGLPDTAAPPRDFAPRAEQELALAVNAAYGVFTAGESVSVLARAVRPVEQNTSLQVRDEKGRVARTMALPFKQREARVALEGLDCGYWRLTTAPSKGEPKTDRIEGEALVAVLPKMPDWPADKWRFGFHFAATEPCLAAGMKLGLRWNRLHGGGTPAIWRVVEPQPGEWTFRDERVTLNQAHGMRMLGNLDAVPRWVWPKSGGTGKGLLALNDNTYPLWREYCRRVADHWKKDIQYWEVTNEPNLKKVSPQAYVALLKHASEGVRAGNPSGRVVGLGGATPVGSSWIPATIRAGAAKHCDAISFHGYGSSTYSCAAGPETLMKAVDRIRAVLAEVGSPDMPLWNSEAGTWCRTAFHKFRVPHGDDPAAMAELYPKSVAAVVASRLERILYFTGSPTTHAGDGGNRFVFDFSNAVKQPAQTLAVAISQLVDATYERRVRHGELPDLVDLRFTSPRGRLRMLWSTRRSETLVIEEGPASISSMYGRRIGPAAGRIAVASQPVYIRTPQ